MEIGGLAIPASESSCVIKGLNSQKEYEIKMRTLGDYGWGPLSSVFLVGRYINGHGEECIVCMDAVKNCVLIPCGHMHTCVPCASLLENCPICRVHVDRVQKVFR